VHEVKTVASDHRKNARGSHHTGAFIVPRPYSCGSIDLTPGEKENKNRKINVFFCFFGRLIFSYTPQISR
jgi:hypothetical protein